MDPAVSLRISPPPLSAQPTRSVFVTVFAWICVSVGTIALPVSLISLLMILAGSHGTANASWSGGLLVIGGPPATLLVGIGLLRRRRWAYGGGLALLVAVAVWNLAPVLRGPTPERTYVSPGGVPTTVLASSVNYPLHGLAIAIALGALAKLLSRPVRAEFGMVLPSPAPTAGSSGAQAPVKPANDAGARAADGTRLREEPVRTFLNQSPDTDRGQGWRVGHQGRDEMYYEEWRDGTWQRIRLTGEMLMGRAHHVIYFASPQAWLTYPEWARHRRDEIIARIKSEFRAPDYEYHGDDPAGSQPSAVAAATSPVVARRRVAAAGTTTRSQWRALFVAIAIMVGIAASMVWLVQRGLAQGETWFPTKQASQRRTVSRAQEPALFWLSIGLYGAVGAGSVGLAGWGIREAVRLRRRERRGGLGV